MIWRSSLNKALRVGSMQKMGHILNGISLNNVRFLTLIRALEE
jgi:hypothetical protein